MMKKKLMKPIKVKMKLRNILIGVLTLCTTSGLMAMNDAQTIAQFQQVLSTKDCEQIRQATIAMWPNSATAAFRLQWSVATNSIVISDNGNNDVNNATHKTCGELLRDFVTREILYPAMHGQKNVNDAMWEIMILNGEKYTLEDFPGPRKGIFGKTGWTEEANMINFAISQARNVPFISTIPIDETLHQKSDALYNYVGRLVNQPAAPQLSYNKSILSAVGIAAFLCIGYALYTKYYKAQTKASDDEDDENAENDPIVEDPKSTVEKAC